MKPFVQQDGGDIEFVRLLPQIAVFFRFAAQLPIINTKGPQMFTSNNGSSLFISFFSAIGHNSTNAC